MEMKDEKKAKAVAALATAEEDDTGRLVFKVEGAPDTYGRALRHGVVAWFCAESSTVWFVPRGMKLVVLDSADLKNWSRENTDRVIFAQSCLGPEHLHCVRMFWNKFKALIAAKYATECAFISRVLCNRANTCEYSPDHLGIWRVIESRDVFVSFFKNKECEYIIRSHAFGVVLNNKIDKGWSLENTETPAAKSRPYPLSETRLPPVRVPVRAP